MIALPKYKNCDVFGVNFMLDTLLEYEIGRMDHFPAQYPGYVYALYVAPMSALFGDWWYR